MLSNTLSLGLILASFLPSSFSHEIPPQITTAPSLSEYNSALAHHALFLERRAKHTSLGSSDALSYCQESVAGCSDQLTLYNACSSIYGTELIYLYCLCTTGYHKAVSQCDACSASLGALPWSEISLDVGNAETECSSLSSSYATDKHTHTGTGTGAGTKTGTGAAEAEATSSLPASTTSTSIVVTMPTEPYAGFAGPPTVPGDDGIAAPTSSQGAAVAIAQNAGMVAGVAVCLGGAVLL